MTSERETLFPRLRVRGYRRSFEPTEETKYVVATIVARIAVDRSCVRSERDHARAVKVMTERVVHNGADAYAWYGAQVDSITLVSVTSEEADD